MKLKNDFVVVNTSILKYKSKLRMEDQENNNTINNSGSVERQQCYRDLLNEIDDIIESSDVGIETVRTVKNILTAANAINAQCDIKHKVVNPEEILLDSSVLLQASDVLLKCTRAVNAQAATYEPLAFAQKIADTIKTGDTVQQLDLVRLIDDAREIIPNVIECSFLYGTFDMEIIPPPKEKKERVKEKQTQVAKKELLVVKNTQEDEQDSNEQTVLFLLKVLQNEYKNNGEKPLKYFDFVTDKDDFGATVENMFYCTFLFRDGRAGLDIDEMDIPLIRPIKKKELKTFRENGGVNTQTIMSVSMDQWNRVKSRMPTDGYVQRAKKALR